MYKHGIFKNVQFACGSGCQKGCECKECYLELKDGLTTDADRCGS